MKLQIRYYDPEICTGPNPDDKGAWCSLETTLEGDGIASPDEDPKVYEKRRALWVQAKFPEVIGKVVISEVLP